MFHFMIWAILTFGFTAGPSLEGLESDSAEFQSGQALGVVALSATSVTVCARNTQISSSVFKIVMIKT